MDNEIIKVVLVVAISYLLGSFPTAYLAARQRGLNIFEVGSGNMGATNVIRSMGFFWGFVVWVVDCLKGILAIVIATQIISDNKAAATAISATAAVVGHNWSLFATLLTGTLRGGKGAAVTFGTMLVIAPFHVIVAMTVLAGFIIALTRYMSLAVLSMFALATVWILILVSQHQLPIEYFYYSLLVALMLVYRFRENIQRLLAGTERRLGDPA